MPFGAKISAEDRPASLAAPWQGKPQPLAQLLVASFAHIFALDDVDNVLGDVRRVIGDAFQIPGDQNEVEGTRDGGRVAHHVRQELAEDLITQSVHLIVAIDDMACELRVLANKSVEA